MRLTVDPTGDVESSRAAVAATGSEVESPKATRRVAAAKGNRDGAKECSADRIEGVDPTVDVAEIPDQQVVAERSEGGGSKSDTPRCGELAAVDQRLQQGPVL